MNNKTELIQQYLTKRLALAKAKQYTFNVALKEGDNLYSSENRTKIAAIEQSFKEQEDDVDTEYTKLGLNPSLFPAMLRELKIEPSVKTSPTYLNKWLNPFLWFK